MILLLDNIAVSLPEKAGTLSALVAEVRAGLSSSRLIVRVRVDGRDFQEEDWETELEAQIAEIAIDTADKFDYLVKRLQTAANYLTQVIAEFSQAAADFKEHKTEPANAALATAVDDLLAFVRWYLSLLLLDRAALGEATEQFRTDVDQVQKICEEILAQQIFENNWLLGEIVTSRLLPALTVINDHAAGLAKSYHAA